VLVIEDSEDAAYTLRDILQLEGHRVTIARDGQSGIAAALAQATDVVLCDIGLPGIDGYEVARRLRADGSRARLIALTGYATPTDVERAREAASTPTWRSRPTCRSSRTLCSARTNAR
jgi:CheY-like chemotaxis protein